MQSVMMKTTAIFLALLLTPAIAFGWRYIAFQDDELVYEGHIPPVNLTYPPPGIPTPTMDIADSLEGVELKSREITVLRSKPHVVIVPSRTELGSQSE